MKKYKFFWIIFIYILFIIKLSFRDTNQFISNHKYNSINKETQIYHNNDIFLSKFKSDGTKEWTRLLGNQESDTFGALSMGMDGAIYIAGNAEGDFEGYRMAAAPSVRAAPSPRSL